MKIKIFQSKFNAYTPYQETVTQMDTSLFSDVYKNAKNSVEEIIEQAEKDNQYKSKNRSPMDCSNIIAFTGERGSGKTSAMTSFASALEQKKYIEKQFIENTSTELYFECLPMIDPSHLTKDETVIDVVISRLYTQFDFFCRNSNDGDSNVWVENKRKVYHQFQEAHKAIRSLCQGRGERHDQADSLETLRYTAAGNEFRNIIYQLFENYLDTIKNECKRRFLVISVDDLDMNVEQGYSICEELRKYFNLPNVIVLFSVKMLQMNDIIRQEYLHWFKDLLSKNYTQNFNLSDSISDMATKYIDKLIPIRRRCALPNFEMDNLCEATVIYEGITPDEQEGSSLVDEILKLLFAKTGLLLVKNDYGSHDFIPTTLRGIVHLVALLQGMQQVDLTENKDKTTKYKMLSSNEKRVLQHNLEVIEDYVREHSISDRITESYREILIEILNEPRYGLNKRIARSLYKLNHNTDGSFSQYYHSMQEEVVESTLYDITSESTMAENVSLGDILFVLNRICIDSPFSTAERFASVLRIIYSIKIIRLVFLGNINQDNDLDTFKKSKNELFKMFGGLIYSPKVTPIIRGNRDWYPSLPLQPIKEDKNRKDWLLMHTMHMGSLGQETNNYYRKSLTEPIYENVDSDSLYTYASSQIKYFAFSYLACLTNCLKDEICLKGDVFKEKYETWKEKNIGVIPLISVDYIDAFVKTLKKDVDKRLKTKSDDLYWDVVKAAKQTIELLNTKTFTNENFRNRVDESVNNFPMWDFNLAKSFSSINDLIPDSNAEIKQQISRMKDQIQRSQDTTKLLEVVKNNISLRGASDNTISQLKKHQTKIGKIRTKIKNVNNEEELQMLKDELMEQLGGMEIELLSLGDDNG